MDATAINNFWVVADRIDAVHFPCFLQYMVPVATVTSFRFKLATMVILYNGS